MSTAGGGRPGAGGGFKTGISGRRSRPQRQTKDRPRTGPHDAKESQNKKNEPRFRDVASEPVLGAFLIETDPTFEIPIRTERDSRLFALPLQFELSMHCVQSHCDRIYPFRVTRGKHFLKFPLQFLGFSRHKYRLSAKSLQDIGFGFRVFHQQHAYSLVHGHSSLFIRSKLEGLLLEEDVIRGQKHATWSEIV